MSTETNTTAPEAPEKSINLLPEIVLLVSCSLSYSLLGLGFSVGIGAFGPEFPKGELSRSQLVIGVGTAVLWPAVALQQVGQKLGGTLKTP